MLAPLPSLCPLTCRGADPGGEEAAPCSWLNKDGKPRDMSEVTFDSMEILENPKTIHLDNHTHLFKQRNAGGERRRPFDKMDPLMFECSVSI